MMVIIQKVKVLSAVSLLSRPKLITIARIVFFLVVEKFSFYLFELLKGTDCVLLCELKVKGKSDLKGNNN